MALILNLETATTVCSVALAKDGEVIALKEINNGYTHSENLTVFIQEIFTGTTYQVTDIDAVSVSKGPGSYTGLRIGVSTAKGLCFALEKPLIAVNTLYAMVMGVIGKTGKKSGGRKHSTFNIQHSTPHTLYCPMIDARRMEVYCAVYDSKGTEIRATAAEIIDEHSFSDLLSENQLIFFGDGAEKCKNLLKHRPNAVFIDNIFPSAKNFAKLSEQFLHQKKFEDVAYFEPFYLKDFVAGKKK